jgi:hypothetical protein
MASVRVAVRVRPFNEREQAAKSRCIIKMESNKTLIEQQMPPPTVTASATTTITGGGGGGGSATSATGAPKEFIYDASYWSFDKNDAHFKSQLDIYNDLGETTIVNAFDGYNACICAYGQTGSGKSYSMMGASDESRDECLAEEGLIPRIGKNLFKRIRETTSGDNLPSSTNYRIEVSYLEIYNEKVRDLLRASASSLLLRKQATAAGVNQQPQSSREQNLKVREHPKTGVYVQDLTQHTVVTYEDIKELIDRGNLNRTTASTNMNDVSSRSHAIFTIKFSQVRVGKLKI